MPSLPVVSGDAFVRAMRLLGYDLVRTSGSHMRLRAEGRPPLPVRRHREIARGTLRGLIREAGLTVEDFLELQRQASK